jgi:hypothetical protein
MTRTREWVFVDSFDAGRRDRLLALDRFDAVVSLLDASIQSVHTSPAPGRDTELQQCMQPVFKLRVSPEAFDAFFNGAAGYRAAYLASPASGLLADLHLVEHLLERLLRSANDQHVPELECIDMRASLLASSCKVWIYEDEFPFQAPSKDLAVDRWVKAAAAGERKAVWGLCAPQGTGIEIKGALIDASGNEIVPRKKILRRYELHNFGFS